MTQPSITNSRLCKYCNQVQIYWDNSKGTLEIETGNKHFCQSASRTKPTTGMRNNFTQPSNTTPKSFMGNSNTQQYRPAFTTGSGKPYTTQQKHSSNSIQVLKGSELEVQKQYKLSDIVTNLGGKIHGSQSHYLDNGLEPRIVVYYEVPASAGTGQENRELVKERLNYYSSKSDY